MGARTNAKNFIKIVQMIPLGEKLWAKFQILVVLVAVFGLADPHDKFYIYLYNVSLLRGEKLIFRSLSKRNRPASMLPSGQAFT